MNRLLFGTFLLVLVFEQCTCYIVPTNNNDNQQINGTSETDYGSRILVPINTEKYQQDEYIDESQALENSELKQTEGSQESANTGKGQNLQHIITSIRSDNSDKMTNIDSQFINIFSNQSSLTKIDIFEIADNHEETDNVNEGYKSEHLQKTETVIMKKLSYGDENETHLKATKVTDIRTTDTANHEDREESNIEKKQVVEIITAICGEQYEPCKQMDYGYRIFRETSICKICSCNAKTCHIYKNCCPDVQVDINFIDKDSEFTEICTTLSEVLSFGKLNVKLSEDNEQNNTSDTKVKNNSSNFNLIKGTENKQVSNFKKLKSEVLVGQKTPKINSSSLLQEDISAGDNTHEKELKQTGKNESNFKEKGTNKDHKHQNMLHEEPETFSELAKRFFPMYSVTETCPAEFEDADIITKCTDKSSPFVINNIPVSDWLTMKTYRNKWCGVCHNISVPQNWKLVTDCLQIYTMENIPPLLTEFYRLTKNCTVRVIPPTGLRADLKACQTSNDSLNFSIIDKCNITGLWNQNSTMIRNLCEQRHFMSFYKDRRIESHITYKNIFCYRCNTDSSWQILEENAQDNNLSGSIYGDTRLYMDINVEDLEAQSAIWFQTYDHQNRTCPVGQIPDVYTDDCIQFECPIYQTAMSNFCLDRNKAVTGLVITSTMHLQFLKPVYVGYNHEKVSAFGRKISNSIEDKLQILKKGCNVRYIKMYANFTHATKHSVQEMFLVYKIANTEKCSVQQVISLNAELDTEKINMTVENAGSQKIPGSSSSFSVGLFFTPVYNYEIETTLIEEPVFYEISLSEKFYCPKILISQSKYTELIQKGNLKFDDDEILHVVSKKQTEKIPICYLKYLEHWLAEMDHAKSSKQPVKNTLTNTLSAISTIVSMVSIVAVLITYSMFPELRFVPGKLFMVLCFNLLLAQSFFSCIDIGGKTIWCQLVGVCIHMFWLSTMFSMNSCLWFMLKNIKDPLGPKNRHYMHSRSNYLVFKYSCYNYGMSALCVLVNVVLSYSVYNDDYYGYGAELCYINMNQMKLVTFALPTALIVIINFFMFTSIMSSIIQTKHTKYNKVAKIQILVFLKLSTITGFYWCFGFLFEATHIKIFKYLFIVFNGGQGFFLMWSFLFNNRIVELYKEMYQKICMRQKLSIPVTSKTDT